MITTLLRLHKDCATTPSKIPVRQRHSNTTHHDVSRHCYDLTTTTHVGSRLHQDLTRYHLPITYNRDCILSRTANYDIYSWTKPDKKLTEHRWLHPDKISECKNIFVSELTHELLILTIQRGYIEAFLQSYEPVLYPKSSLPSSLDKLGNGNIMFCSISLYTPVVNSKERTHIATP